VRRRAAAFLLAVAATLPTATFAAEDAAMLGAGAIRVTPRLLGRDLCNSGAFAQLPTDPDLFAGRLLTPTPTSCRLLGEAEAAGTRRATLALFRMDWRANTLSVVESRRLPRAGVQVTQGLEATKARPATTSTLLPPMPLTLPAPMLKGAARPTISAAYDPTVAQFRGELWIAFECVTNHVFPVARRAGVSACVAPFTTSYGIDLRRLTVAVTGTAKSPSASNEIYAAAVPQLFTFGERIYLYWSAIHSFPEPGAPNWRSIAVRGMELAAATGKDGKTRLWGVGAGPAPVDSYDPALNAEVAAPIAGDPTANTAQDVSGVFVDAGSIYLMTNVGGSPVADKSVADKSVADKSVADKPCVAPSSPQYGCFRLRIARATAPLPAAASDAPPFNRHVLTSPLPPFNPGEYRHIIIDPTARDGRSNLWMIGAYLPEPRSFPYTVSPPLPNQDNILPAGLLRFPIRLDLMRF